jgi:hypothetical protein
VIAREQVLAAVLPLHENGKKKKSNGILNSWTSGVFDSERREPSCTTLYAYLCSLVCAPRMVEME